LSTNKVDLQIKPINK